MPDRARIECAARSGLIPDDHQEEFAENEATKCKRRVKNAHPREMRNQLTKAGPCFEQPQPPSFSEPRRLQKAIVRPPLIIALASHAMLRQSSSPRLAACGPTGGQLTPPQQPSQQFWKIIRQVSQTALVDARSRSPCYWRQLSGCDIVPHRKSGRMPPLLWLGRRFGRGASDGFDGDCADGGSLSHRQSLGIQDSALSGNR